VHAEARGTPESLQLRHRSQDDVLGCTFCPSDGIASPAQRLSLQQHHVDLSLRKLVGEGRIP